MALWIETNYSPAVALQLAIYLPLTFPRRCCCCSRSKAPWSAFSGRCACTALTRMRPARHRQASVDQARTGTDWGRNERSCARREGRERGRPPSLFPAEGRSDADPDRSHPARSQRCWSENATTTWCSCRANIVFPGGRVDSSDNRVPVAAPITNELEANLLKGSPKITPARARALAIAAIREACEETGLCLGRKTEMSRQNSKGPGSRSPMPACCPILRPVPDCARDHPARPGPPLRHPLLHGRCLRHRPPRRRRDPCRCRVGRTRLGRDRLKALGGCACHDQERAGRTRSPPCHWPAPP